MRSELHTGSEDLEIRMWLISCSVITFTAAKAVLDDNTIRELLTLVQYTKKVGSSL